MDLIFHRFPHLDQVRNIAQAAVAGIPSIVPQMPYRRGEGKQSSATASGPGSPHHGACPRTSRRPDPAPHEDAQSCHDQSIAASGLRRNSSPAASPGLVRCTAQGTPGMRGCDAPGSAAADRSRRYSRISSTMATARRSRAHLRHRHDLGVEDVRAKILVAALLSLLIVARHLSAKIVR